MSLDVTFDPSVFAIPSPTTTASEVRHFVEALLAWDDLLDHHWPRLYKTERLEMALVEDDCYPFATQLQQLFQRCGIVEYSANDMVATIGRLLARTRSFEDHFGLADALLLDDEIELTPDVLHSAPGLRLGHDLARCILFVAVLQDYCCDDTDQHIIALRHATANAVRVRAQLLKLEHTRPDLERLPTPPILVDRDVPACQDVGGLVHRIDEVALLQRARDDHAIQVACRVAVLKARGELAGAFTWQDVDAGDVGPQFRQSAQRCCRNAPPDLPGKLLRAVAQTLNRNNLRDTHPLRVTRGGNARQRTRVRDQATAWRRSIDDEYRLHYWLLPHGRVELAWVGPHNDFTIPE